VISVTENLFRLTVVNILYSSVTHSNQASNTEIRKSKSKPQRLKTRKVNDNSAIHSNVFTL